VENGEEEPVKNHDGDTKVGHSPPRGDKRGDVEGNNLTPVKSKNAHGQTMGDAKELVDYDIMRSYPANPREA
jgi:hypothetical protein